ncbi:MAG: ABC transporter permease [Deltaproteobacteria bacterium]|jgi:ABC-type lipoprotein release transport system permease subunit|nr:ABC transporter permease [Deltaproteobacteria bacterium]
MATIERTIALRYLRAKRRDSLVSLISVLAVGGVGLGVAALIVVLAVLNGFETNLKTKLLGLSPHVSIFKAGGNLTDWETVVAKIKTVPGVKSALPFIQGQALAASGQGASGVVIMGLDPQATAEAGFFQVLNLDPQAVKNLTQRPMVAPANDLMRLFSPIIFDDEEEYLPDEPEDSAQEELGDKSQEELGDKSQDETDPNPLKESVEGSFKGSGGQSNSESAPSPLKESVGVPLNESGGQLQNGWRDQTPFGAATIGQPNPLSATIATAEAKVDRAIPPRENAAAKEAPLATLASLAIKANQRLDVALEFAILKVASTDKAATFLPLGQDDAKAATLLSSSQDDPKDAPVDPEKVRPDAVDPDKVGPEKVGPEKVGLDAVGPDEDASNGQAAAVDFEAEAPEPVRPILLGRELALSLGAGPLSAVRIISPFGRITPLGQRAPLTRYFQVAGTFQAHYYDFDSKLAFTDLEEAADLLGLVPGEVSYVEVKVFDIYQADRIHGEIIELLGPDYWGRDWMRMNLSLFSALKLERTAMFVILTLIVLVAAFNIASTLIMMVAEKTRDIAILKAMGATSAQIKRIFTWQGLIVGLVGTLGGLIVGIVLCLLLKRYEFISLPPEIYLMSSLPVELRWPQAAAITLVSMAISYLATVYPAKRAASFDPVEALRYE